MKRVKTLCLFLMIYALVSAGNLFAQDEISMEERGFVSKKSILPQELIDIKEKDIPSEWHKIFEGNTKKDRISFWESNGNHILFLNEKIYPAQEGMGGFDGGSINYSTESGNLFKKIDFVKVKTYQYVGTYIWYWNDEFVEPIQEFIGEYDMLGELSQELAQKKKENYKKVLGISGGIVGVALILGGGIIFYLKKRKQ